MAYVKYNEIAQNLHWESSFNNTVNNIRLIKDQIHFDREIPRNWVLVKKSEAFYARKEKNSSIEQTRFTPEAYL